MKDIYTLKNRDSDLDFKSECWIMESAAQRREEIYECKKKLQERLCIPNLQPFREIVFACPLGVKIDHLAVLSRQIEALWGIKCFQITIDRSDDTAHMLVDWIDRTTGKGIHLYNSKRNILSGLILRTIGCPLSEIDNQYLRSLLTYLYSVNHCIFDQITDWALQQHPTPIAYEVMVLSMAYLKNMCDGNARN